MDPIDQASLPLELEHILRMSGGAHTLFVTDRDGVPIISVGEELRGRQNIIANYIESADQMNKFGMGRQKVSLFSYENMQLVLMSFPHVTVFIVAKTEGDANIAMMMQLRHEITKVLPLLERTMQYTMDRATVIR